MGLGILSMNLERALAVDFSKPYFQETVTFATSVGKRRLPWTLVTDPFEPKVWLGILLLQLIIPPILKGCLSLGCNENEARWKHLDMAPIRWMFSQCEFSRFSAVDLAPL